MMVINTLFNCIIMDTLTLPSTGIQCLRRSPGKCTGSTPVYAIVAPVSGIITSFGISFHQFTNDTQLYISVDPGDVRHYLSILDRCSCAVHDLFTHNGLSLNPSKSEILFIGTRQQVDKVSCSEVTVLGCKSPGVRLDKNLTFNKHVDETYKSIHYHSLVLRHIRGNLNVDTAKTIACAIGSSRLDYCKEFLGRTWTWTSYSVLKT